jgi:hypothetical protein
VVKAYCLFLTALCMRDALLSHAELLPLYFSILLHDFYLFLFVLSLPVSSRNAFELCSCNAILSLSSHPLALSYLSVSFSNHFLFFSFLFFFFLLSTHTHRLIFTSLCMSSLVSLSISRLAIRLSYIKTYSLSLPALLFFILICLLISSQ